MRRIRNVGIVAAMALTLAAIGASSAPAAGFTASSYPALVVGDAYGMHVIGNHEMGQFDCNRTSSSLHWNDGLSQPATTLATETADAACSFAGLAFTMKMNGCGLILHPGPGSAPGPGTIEIGPKGCGPITMTVPYSKCEVKIPAQTGLAATFANHGSSKVEVVMQASGIEMIVKGGNCGAEHTVKTGSWSGVWVASGISPVTGSPIDIQIGPVPTGLFLSEGQFDAEEFPVSVTGAQEAGDTHTLTLAVGAVKCSEAQFTGDASAASSELALQPTYSGTCSTRNLAGTKVSTNGCEYVLNAAGSTSIACPPGASIQVKMTLAGVTKCTTTIPAQSGLSSVSFENHGSGNERAIDTTFSLSGIQYTQQTGTGAGVCTSGEFKNGTYTGGVTLHGFR